MWVASTSFSIFSAFFVTGCFSPGSYSILRVTSGDDDYTTAFSLFRFSNRTVDIEKTHMRPFAYPNAQNRRVSDNSKKSMHSIGDCVRGKKSLKNLECVSFRE